MKDIDWALLRQQKAHLLEVIALGGQRYKMVTEEQAESLTGILHLIDDIQDEAVDVNNITNSEVFG